MEDSEKTLEVAEPTTEETEQTVAEPEEKAETNEETLEFTDTHETTEKEEVVEEKKEVQSQEDNSKYAQARRKAEAEMELKVKEAYQKGRMESFIGKLNPYTQTVIKDETDIQVYENMYALDQQGKDPVTDYAGYVADKQREEAKAKAEADKLQKEAENDIAEFTEKYPDINLSELLEDDMFKDYIEGKRKPLITLYENYQKMQNSFRNKAVDVAKQTIANSQATPGSLGSGSDVTVDYRSMSKAEFEKYVQKAKDGELR